MPIHIIGTGSYLPEKRLSNQDLEKLVETSDEWITTRTGIKSRHIAADGEACSDLAVHAARKALESADIRADQLDMILVATCTPDMPFPSTACFVQDKIGASSAFCMDLAAACSGFLYAVEVARNFLLSGRCQNALVIGSEKMSNLVDWSDRTTCILFGDGAGAVVLTASERPGGLGPCILGSDGTLHGLLHVPGGGSRLPPTPEVVGQRLNTIKMHGGEVFKHAVNNMTQTAFHLLEEAGWAPGDLDIVIPHQANRRILEAIRTRVGVDPGKVFVNVDRCGNTSAASIGIALDEAVRGGVLQEGDKVLLLAFGAGFTWGGLLMEWRNL